MKSLVLVLLIISFSFSVKGQVLHNLITGEKTKADTTKSIPIINKNQIDSTTIRYFRVTYFCGDGTNHYYGSSLFISRNGDYLGKRWLINHLKGHGFQRVVILDIREMKKDDYNYFINH